MHFIVRNILWGERGNVAHKDQELPSSFLVRNALSKVEAVSSSKIHFDAEINEAEVSLVTDLSKVRADAVVNNG